MGNCFLKQIHPTIIESESESNSPLSELKQLTIKSNKVDMTKLNQQQIREIYVYESNLHKFT